MAGYVVLSRIKTLDGYHLPGETVELDSITAGQLLAAGCVEQAVLEVVFDGEPVTLNITAVDMPLPLTPISSEPKKRK